MSKAKDIMLDNIKFYSKQNRLEKFLTFIQKKNSALRTLNWFATNHTKIVDVNINGKNIRLDYLQQLKAYQKEFFDPFRRNKRILLSWEFNSVNEPINFKWKYTDKEFCNESVNNDVNSNDETKPVTQIVTTIAQLNFFKWAIDRGVLEYIKDNMESIKETQSSFSKRKGTTKGTIVKRVPISNQTVQKVIIEF